MDKNISKTNKSPSFKKVAIKKLLPEHEFNLQILIQQLQVIH